MSSPSSSPSDLRHGIRGNLNAIKLCVSALEIPLETSEKIQFLTAVVDAAEKLGLLVEELDACSADPAGDISTAAESADVR